MVRASRPAHTISQNKNELERASARDEFGGLRTEMNKPTGSQSHTPSGNGPTVRRNDSRRTRPPVFVIRLPAYLTVIVHVHWFNAGATNLLGMGSF